MDKTYKQCHDKPKTSDNHQTGANSLLKTLDNPHSDRDYIIALEISGLTCLCPIGDQPSFGKLVLEYVPDKLCVQLGSLRQYVQSFRNTVYFQEDLANTIVNQLAGILAPRYIKLSAKFQATDGVSMQVTVDYHQKDWLPQQLLLPQHPKLLNKPI